MINFFENQNMDSMVIQGIDRFGTPINPHYIPPHQAIYTKNTGINVHVNPGPVTGGTITITYDVYMFEGGPLLYSSSGTLVGHDK